MSRKLNIRGQHGYEISYPSIRVTVLSGLPVPVPVPLDSYPYLDLSATEYSSIPEYSLPVSENLSNSSSYRVSYRLDIPEQDDLYPELSMQTSGKYLYTAA